MATNYPGSLDTTTQLPDNFVDGTATATVHAQTHNNVDDAIIAIETELGILPKGTFSDVAARLAHLLVYNSDITQTIQPNADVVSVVFKLKANTSIADFWEAKDALGNTKASLNYQGIFNSAGYLINGTPIASADLSDGPFAPLDSPHFTGDPTCPTPDIGDDSTQITNTHWVRLQEYVGAGFVNTALNAYAKLASPAFTGVPTAPTASTPTNTTQIATTAFVKNAISASAAPSFTIGQHISDLAPNVDGKAALLRVGNSPYDFMKVIYDATYGHWIGDTIQQSHHQDPLIGFGLDASQIVVKFPVTYPTTLSYLLTTPWKVWDTAGLKPQTRVIWSGAMVTASGSTFYLRLGYHGIDVAQSPPTIIPLHEATNTGIVPSHYDSGWRDLSNPTNSNTTPTVKDDLAVGVQLRATTNDRANLLYAIAMVRWISA